MSWYCRQQVVFEAIYPASISKKETPQLKQTDVIFIPFRIIILIHTNNSFSLKSINLSLFKFLLLEISKLFLVYNLSLVQNNNNNNNIVSIPGFGLTFLPDTPQILIHHSLIFKQNTISLDYLNMPTFLYAWHNCSNAPKNFIETISFRANKFCFRYNKKKDSRIRNRNVV